MERILHRASEEELTAAGVVSTSDGGAATVPVVAPIVRFSADAAELLLGLYASAPLDGCTYYGVDAGGAAVPVNLYLDILGACCTATSFDEYCTAASPPPLMGTPSGEPRSPGGSATPQATHALAGNSSVRELLWKTFHQVELTAVFPPGLHAASDTPSPFCYVTSAAEQREFLTAASGPLWTEGLGGSVVASRTAHASIDGSTEGTAAGGASVVLNSVLEGSSVGAGCVVEHCALTRCAVGAGAVVSGVEASDLTVAPDTVVQLARLDGDVTAMLTYGIADDLGSVPPVQYCGERAPPIPADTQSSSSVG